MGSGNSLDISIELVRCIGIEDSLKPSIDRHTLISSLGDDGTDEPLGILAEIVLLAKTLLRKTHGPIQLPSAAGIVGEVLLP